jgi:biotin operon repressor
MKLKAKQIERIKSLSLKGLSKRQIAEKIGCARSAVWYWLNK